jgi:iron complex outermembrane receptor protein
MKATQVDLSGLRRERAVAPIPATLLVGMLTASVGTLTQPQQANAATAPAAAGDAESEGLQEIVVQARKRSENLQDVPTSITAVSGADLKNQQIVLLQDVSALTPNLVFKPSGADAADAVVSMRGQVYNQNSASADPAVGLYVDGLYWGTPLGSNASLFDIDSIDILKGPQGTLFGQNTTGGAILIKTADPQADGVHANAAFSYGNFSRKQGDAMLNVPVSDAIAFRVAGQWVQSNGMLPNDILGTDQQGTHTLSLRAKVLADITDDIRLTVSYDYFGMNQRSTPWVLNSYTPGTYTDYEIAAEGASYGPLSNFIPHNYGSSFGNSPTGTQAATHTASATLNWNLGAMQLKAITGYRKAKHTSDQDLDGSPYNILLTDTSQNTDEWTGELQLGGQALNDTLKYVFGVFAYEADTYEVTAPSSLLAINATNPSLYNGNINSNSSAVYAQATQKLTSALSLTAGLRVANESKTLDSHNQVGPAPYTCVVPVELRVAPNVCSTDLKNSTNGRFSYTVGLDYKLTANSMVYVKTSRAYRAGGWNVNGNSEGSLAPFGEEEITDYEVGSKNEFLDKRLRFNIAAFYSNYKDIQRQVIELVPVGTGFVSTEVVRNAAKARITGGEADLTALVTGNFQVNIGAGITSPKYLDYRDATGDLSHQQFDLVPHFTGDVALQYQHSFAGWELLVRPVYHYISAVSHAEGSDAQWTTQGGYGLLDARISLTQNDKLTYSVFGNNLANKHYFTDALDFTSSLGYSIVDPGLLRTYGVELSYKF